MKSVKTVKLENVRCPVYKKVFVCLRTFYPLIFRYLTENQLPTIIETQLFSRFCLPNDNMAMSTIPKDHVVLGLGYNLGDIQLRISGSRKEGEQTIMTALREIREETGLIVSRKNLQFICTSKKQKNGRPCSVTHYSLNVDDCDDLEFADDYLASENTDDASKKVSIIVHGSAKSQTLSKVVVMAKPTDPNEMITFYALVPLPIALFVTGKIDVSDDTSG